MNPVYKTCHTLFHTQKSTIFGVLCNKDLTAMTVFDGHLVSFVNIIKIYVRNEEANILGIYFQGIFAFIPTTVHWCENKNIEPISFYMLLVSLTSFSLYCTILYLHRADYFYGLSKIKIFFTVYFECFNCCTTCYGILFSLHLSL